MNQKFTPIPIPKPPQREVRLFAMGANHGPLKDSGPFELTTEAAQLIAAKRPATPLRCDMNGPSRAAGWGRLEVREDGLWLVDVSWTQQGLDALPFYDSLSPYFVTRKDKIEDVLEIWLARSPAIDARS